MLQTVGKRYELLEYHFIEDRASPGNPDHEMRSGVRDCDAIAMIFHKEKGKAAIREGLLKEYNLSVELKKSIFMFTQEGFVTRTKERADLISAMRNRKGIYSAQFSNNEQLVDRLEKSLFDFMLSSTREKLIALGQSGDEGIALPEVRDRQEVTSR